MSRPKILVLATSAAVIATLAVLPSSAAFASNTVHWVTASDISASRAASGATTWFAEPNHSGTFATTSTAFDSSTSLQLATPASADGMRVLNSYGAGVTPPTIAQIQSGGSFTYSGSNVDFQIELFFTPSDSSYGPDPADGATKCTAAGAAYPGMCYTVIKWEPLATSPSAWSTVDLSSNAALTATTGGWKNTNEIGIYPKPGALIGNTMSEYVAQMANYQVIAVGVSLGTGSPAGVGYVKSLTYASTTYNFESEPMISPSMSPLTDSGKVGASYLKPISATGTQPLAFSISGGSLPDGLTMDPATGIISGTPTSHGTSNFTVTVSGPGGTTSAAGTITIAALPTLATTGVDVAPALTLAIALFVIALALMLIDRRRRRMV